MTRTLVLLSGLLFGVAVESGANEARAAGIFHAARSVAQTTPDRSFVPVGFKRHGFHRAPGGVHKSFSRPRFSAGKRFGHRGVVVRKGFVGPRLFVGKHFRSRGVTELKRFPGSRFLPGTGHRGGIVARKELISPRLFLGKRFGDGGVIVRFVGTQRFIGQRFAGSGSVVRNGSVGTKLFVGRRFGDGQVVVRHAFVGPQTALGKGFRHRSIAAGGHRRPPHH
jgi:hypothetical protein